MFKNLALVAGVLIFHWGMWEVLGLRFDLILTDGGLLIMALGELILAAYAYWTIEEKKEAEEGGRLTAFWIQTALCVLTSLIFLLFDDYYDPPILAILAIGVPIICSFAYYSEEWKALLPESSDGGDYVDYGSGSDGFGNSSSYGGSSGGAPVQSHTPERSKDIYTVNFRYKSGSAVKDESILMYSDHQPGMAEIKQELRSRHYPDDAYIYCLRFGGGLPAATESHPDNLLR
jgi:hypothetical protein